MNKYFSIVIAFGVFITTINMQTTLAAQPVCDRFFYMNTWFWHSDIDLEQQCEILNDVGVPQQSYPLNENQTDLEQFKQAIELFQQHEIKMIAAYNTVSIDEPGLPDHVVESMKLLEGTDTIIWLALVSDQFEPSSPEGDQKAIAFLEQAAEHAEKYGLAISIYPHTNFWLQATDDILRLMPELKQKHSNIGATFNLYHWLKVEGPENLTQKAQAMMPYINCVTINGSFNNAKEMPVKDAILPLGEGDYDVKKFVSIFEELGYNGPIGHQGWGIEGEIHSKMKQAYQHWLEICQTTQ